MLEAILAISLIIGLMSWILILQYRQIPSLKGFTEYEKIVLKRQATVAFILIPLLLLVMVPLITEKNLVPPIIYAVGGALVLGYIAVTSIVHQVSIFRSKGQAEPSKGKRAIIYSVLVIVFIFVIGWELLSNR
ncbi:MAG TPA: hypothetical protein PKZ84_08460 [Anaerolineae bacterium]|nr:hypothetical protein [Anaerolineae bacterium]HQI84414.1 hypothetical protein [Anaerolineae bacterium]